MIKGQGLVRVRGSSTAALATVTVLMCLMVKPLSGSLSACHSIFTRFSQHTQVDLLSIPGYCQIPLRCACKINRRLFPIEDNLHADPPTDGRTCVETASFWL